MRGPPLPQARRLPVVLLLLNVVLLCVITSSFARPSSAPGRKQDVVLRGLLLRTNQQHLGPTAAQLKSEQPVTQAKQVQVDWATEGGSKAVDQLQPPAPARTSARHSHSRAPGGTRPAAPQIASRTDARDATHAATAAAASAAAGALIHGFLAELPPSQPRCNPAHSSHHPAQLDTTTSAVAGDAPLAGRRKLRSAGSETPVPGGLAQHAPGEDANGQAPGAGGTAVLGPGVPRSSSMAEAVGSEPSASRPGVVTLLVDGPRGVLVLPDAENVTAETPGAPAATGAAAQRPLAAAEQQQEGQQAASPAALQLEQLQPDGSQQLPAAPPDVALLALQQCSAARDPALQLLAEKATNGEGTADSLTPSIGAQPPAEAGATAAGAEAPQPSPVMLHPMASGPAPSPPPAVPEGAASPLDATAAPATDGPPHRKGPQGPLLQGMDAGGGTEAVFGQGPGGGGSGGQADQLSALGMLMAVSQPGRCTGSLISPCHVLTAAHCIFEFAGEGDTAGAGASAGTRSANQERTANSTEDSEGSNSSAPPGTKLITQWDFIPGWDGITAPYGVYPSRTAVITDQLMRLGDPSYDLGLVVLAGNVSRDVGPFFEVWPLFNESDATNATSMNHSSNATAAPRVGAYDGAASVKGTDASPPGMGAGSALGAAGGSRGLYGGTADRTTSNSPGPSSTYQVMTIDGVAMIVQSPSSGGSVAGGGGGGGSGTSGGGGSGESQGESGQQQQQVDDKHPCLNYAGYPTPDALWAQYCRYVADLDSNNFVELNCRGRPGVSGAPLWVYIPPQGNSTTSQGSPTGTDAPAAGAAGEGDLGRVTQSTDAEARDVAAAREAGDGAGVSGRSGDRGRRVVRAVLTAGVPGGPTAAVRIDQEMYDWIRDVQARHPCA